MDKYAGIRCDQIVVLPGFHSANNHPDKLRRIKCHDGQTDKTLVFLTNNLPLPTLTVAG